MDGIIILNKEKGYTSHDVVNKAKRILNEKVGHTGTLDPNATGVLPILVGKGTKLSFYLINHDKEYEVVLQLGQKTETADSEGKVIEEEPVSEDSFDLEKIKQVFLSVKGKQMQTPPMYSAIKIKGKKLYEYAREGKHVEVKQRQIEIYDIVLLNIDEENKQISFRVACSKGTYIRSLCERIAEELGTVGYMKELNRTKVGIFSIEDSILIDDLENHIEKEEYRKQHVISIEDLFIKLYGKESFILLDQKQLPMFLNGVKLTKTLKDGLYRIYNEKSDFIGVGLVENNLLKREIVVENEI